MSDFKPGAIAAVDSWRGKGQPAFRVYRSGVGADWCVLDGTDTRGLADNEVTDARPLVVIDPDDAEQIERLYDEVEKAQDSIPYTNDEKERNLLNSSLATALREFANPTLPKCDAGLLTNGTAYSCDFDAGHEGSHHDRAKKQAWITTTAARP